MKTDDVEKVDGKGGALTRRGFVKGGAAAGAATWGFQVVPRHVIGQGQTPPSEMVGAALIGAGGRGPSTYSDLTRKHGLPIRKIADCDVKYVGSEDGKTRYSDFRRLLERKDLDVVAIATPPHWHALISIAAMEAGKDVVCEKPMTRTIAEGRAVVEAAERTKRIYQIGTYGRFGQQGKEKLEMRKMMQLGFAKGRGVRYLRRGGFKVRQWSGPVNVAPQEVPANLNWNLYCGPSPLKPYQPPRFGGMHRGYWDYDGGGLSDMGQHYLDPLTFLYGKDDTGPVEIEAHAPPAHPEVVGLWGWVKHTFADGFELILESGEWGELTGLKTVGLRKEMLTDEERATLAATPDPEPLVGFGEAVKTRKLAGGNASVAHRTCSLLHLTNIAIRTGRKLKWDPEKEVFEGDEEANRLVDQPMRAPWHL